MNHLLRYLLLVLTWLLNCTIAQTNFYVNGPYTVARFDVGSIATPLSELAPYHLHVWAPNVCTGPLCNPNPQFPVLVYVSGFAGGMDVRSYESLFDRIASHGTLVVGVDKEISLLSINYPKLGAQLLNVVNYINDDTKLKQQLVNIGINATILKSKKIIGGHSAGNHVTLQHLVDFKCGEFAAVIMNSPVDGADPFGFVDQYITPSSGEVDFVIPALHLKGSLDPAKLSGFPSCAPEGMANERFYNAWQGASVFFVSNGVGHMDMCSNLQPAQEGACPEGPNPLQVDFQNFSATYMAAFIAAIVGRNQSAYSFLLSEPVPLVGSLNSTLKGTKNLAPSTIPPFACAWNPKYNPTPAIIGGTVGGFCFFSLCFLGYYYHKHKTLPNLCPCIKDDLNDTRFDAPPDWQVRKVTVKDDPTSTT